MTKRLNIAGDQATVSADIEHFRSDLERYQNGKIPDAIFLEGRLRFGVYGQRQDGVHMMRSKLPLGMLDGAQLEAFADISERFGNGNAHLTTRQDIQTHFVSLEQTPDLMHVLNSERMTAREACGNVVRNVTASPLAGVSSTELFDVTPYGMALAEYLLRHPDAQSLGRKVKINLSGDDDPRYNLSSFHDIGLQAALRNGIRGFKMLVGGGLGPVPHEAQLFSEFVPAREIIPLSIAIIRVFGKHGEKKNRARARMKFLVAQWGIERFRQEVALERSQLTDIPLWDEFVDTAKLESWKESPSFESTNVFPEAQTQAEQEWLGSNVIAQQQEGFATVVVRVPSGDLTPFQLRGLAATIREVAGEDTLRIGLDQSLFLRWIPFDRLLTTFRLLDALELALPRASGLGDTVTCPGADTCKLGITSPRALARSIQSTLDALGRQERLQALRIHVSGCPNSCAQHQIADIGWFGATRSQGGVSSPHYMLVLGGRAGGISRPGTALGSGFGNIVAKIPAFQVGAATTALLDLYLREVAAGEVFGDMCRRIGFPALKKLLAPFKALPTVSEAPWAYKEPGSQDNFVVQRGIGECAGEAVERSDLLLTEAEGESDRAVELLEEGAVHELIATHAHKALELAARALLSTEGINTLDKEGVSAAFREHFYDRGRIFEGVGYYFLAAQHERPEAVRGDRVRRLAVEAGLFVEEIHSIIARLRSLPPTEELVTLEKRV